jgi:hypothetical protein
MWWTRKTDTQAHARHGLERKGGHDPELGSRTTAGVPPERWFGGPGLRTTGVRQEVGVGVAVDSTFSRP